MSSLGVLIYIEKMNIKTGPRLARVKKINQNHSLGQARLDRKNHCSWKWAHKEYTEIIYLGKEWADKKVLED